MKQQSMLSLLVFVTILCGQSDTAPGRSDDTIANVQQCPLVRCAGPCPNGFVINERGCQTCECNPCRFGQPLYKYPCGGGKNICGANKGLCKVGTADIAYCCPKERPGCCPPGPDPSVALCLPAKCKSDYDCPVGKKCCAPCFSCVNATLY